MDTLAEHLRHQPAAVIHRGELNEIILLVYNTLGWALRDRCDTIRFTRHNVTWLCGDLPLGQFAESPLQTMTFRAAMALILRRDTIVRQHLRRIAEDDDEVTYLIIDEVTPSVVFTTSGAVARSGNERS